MEDKVYKKDKKNYCTFYIVRHGETKWNVEKKIQGHGDSPLTALGIKQVRETAVELKKIKFDAIFSSDLLRAKRTAEIIALERKLVIQTTRLLRERKYSELEGKHISVLDEVHRLYDGLSHKERVKHKISPNIESEEEIISRFITFLREIAVEYPDKNILVVTHGGMMRALLVHLGFATYRQLYVRSIGNAAYVKLLSDGVDFFIEETKGVKKEEKRP